VVPPNGRPLGDGSGTGLAERWLAVDVAAGAAWDIGVTGTAVESGEDVLALGVTTPDDALPLDIRFWHLEADDEVRRVVPRSVPGPEAGSWLYLPDASDQTAVDGWPAGTYQVDVLLGPRIVRLVTIVPSGAPAHARDPEVGDPPALVEQLIGFDPGPFAMTPRRPVAITVVPHAPLTERQAWLGPATGDLEIAALGRVAADPISGLGLTFEPGEELVSAHLERVAPLVADPDVQTIPLPPIPTIDGSRRSGVLLEHGDLRALATGLYHLSAETVLGSGESRSRTWTIEIAPSTAPPGQPLIRMARWVPLMSDLDRLAGEPLVSGRDRTGDDGTCGGSARIRTTDELFGVIEPPGFVVGDIRLRPLRALRADDLPIRVAPNVADGLTLVAVPGGGLAATRYELTVTSTSPAAPESFEYTVCVG
jgi:hypothetical protein